MTVNGIYNVKNDNITVDIVFNNPELSKISDRYINVTNPEFLKPKEKVINEVKNKFEKCIRREKIREEGIKMSKSENNLDVNEYALKIGSVKLNEKGQICDIKHYTSYESLGASGKSIKNYLEKRKNN